MARAGAFPAPTSGRRAWPGLALLLGVLLPAAAQAAGRDDAADLGLALRWVGTGAAGPRSQFSFLIEPVGVRSR